MSRLLTSTIGHTLCSSSSPVLPPPAAVLALALGHGGDLHAVAAIIGPWGSHGDVVLLSLALSCHHLHACHGGSLHALTARHFIHSLTRVHRILLFTTFERLHYLRSPTLAVCLHTNSDLLCDQNFGLRGKAKRPL